MNFVGREPGRNTVASNGLNTIRSYVRRNPNKVAVQTENSSLNYGDLWRRAIKLANAMISQGIKKGDLIITYMPNCPQYVEIMIAAQMIGAPLTLGNYRLTSDEIAYQINDCRAALVYVDTNYLKNIESIIEKIPTVRHIVVIGSKPGNGLDYEEFLNSGSDTELNVELLPDDLHLLFYTSGTTGRPKGAARSMYSDYSVGVSTIIALGLNSDDRFLVVAPMYAAATTGYIITMLAAGGTLFIAPAFVPEDTLRLIHVYKPTFLFMVPIMYDWMFSLSQETLTKYDISSIRVAVACGAPMHSSIFEKMVLNLKTKNIFNMLGASELGFVCLISADEWLNNGKSGSVGKPMFDVEIKIVSKDGKEVPPGDVGLLYCRTTQVLDGYWHNEKGTQEAFLGHEWVTVGDMARMDNDGYFYLVDRAKDMIVSGGTNVYPAEVEGVIIEMEGIADVAVIGVPDEKWGEQVKAVIVLKTGYSISEEKIVSFCKEHLAGFKVPKSVDFVESLPRSPIGKLLRKDIRIKYWNGKDVFVS